MRDNLAKYNLPKKVKVKLSKSKEGGFVVEFPQLPGCFTQIEDLSELHENVTDAVLTYFDVPRSKVNKAIYIPETKVSLPKDKAIPTRSLEQTKFDLFVAA